MRVDRGTWLAAGLVLGLGGCGGADPVSPPVGDGAAPAASLPRAVITVPPTTGDGVVDVEDGDLGGGRVDAWADVPALTGLDPALLGALRRASAAVGEDGVVVEVTSGWRSREYQQQLLDEAVAEHGSPQEAARWVATPDASAHVTGDAVDVGPTDAAYWMAENGPRFGLCQVYANEIWHYELLAGADGTCPAMRADGSS